MESGKSTVGKALAVELGLPFIDIEDKVILREKMDISEIFATKEEFYFRQIEKKIIKYHLLKVYVVISIGGGAFVQSDTRALIKQQAISVWLSVNNKILAKRLDKSGEIEIGPCLISINH